MNQRNPRNPGTKELKGTSGTTAVLTHAAQGTTSTQAATRNTSKEPCTGSSSSDYFLQFLGLTLRPFYNYINPLCYYCKSCNHPQGYSVLLVRGMQIQDLDKGGSREPLLRNTSLVTAFSHTIIVHTYVAWGELANQCMASLLTASEPPLSKSCICP